MEKRQPEWLLLLLVDKFLGEIAVRCLVLIELLLLTCVYETPLKSSLDKSLDHDVLLCF